MSHLSSIKRLTCFGQRVLIADVLLVSISSCVNTPAMFVVSEKKMNICRETCLKNTGTVMSWYYRHCVWLVPTDHVTLSYHLSMLLNRLSGTVFRVWSDTYDGFFLVGVFCFNVICVWILMCAVPRYFLFLYHFYFILCLFCFVHITKIDWLINALSMNPPCPWC